MLHSLLTGRLVKILEVCRKVIDDVLYIYILVAIIYYILELFSTEIMSNDDSYSGNDSNNEDSLLTSTSSSSDSDGEININNWTVHPTVNRDPFQFVDNSKVQVNDARIPIEFWNYIFPMILVESIVHETNCYAEKIYNNFSVRHHYSRIRQWESTIQRFHCFTDTTRNNKET